MHRSAQLHLVRNVINTVIARDLVHFMSMNIKPKYFQRNQAEEENRKSAQCMSEGANVLKPNRSSNHFSVTYYFRDFG